MLKNFSVKTGLDIGRLGERRQGGGGLISIMHCVSRLQLLV